MRLQDSLLGKKEEHYSEYEDGDVLTRAIESIAQKESKTFITSARVITQDDREVSRAS